MDNTVVNDSLSEVLNQLIKDFGITEAGLARAINMPRATINRIKNGAITDPKTSTLLLIADYFHISLDQLLGREPISFPKIHNIRIPLINVLKLKKDIKQPLKEFDNEEWINFEYKGNSKKLFAFKVSGDAMWPYFDNNSILIVDTELVPQNQNFVVVHLHQSNDIVIRKLLIDGSTMILQAINDVFQNITLKKKDNIIGVIIHAKKDL